MMHGRKNIKLINKKINPHCVIDQVYISRYIIIHEQSKFLKVYLRKSFCLTSSIIRPVLLRTFSENMKLKKCEISSFTK
jgi:hypothetical protein